MIEQEQQIPQVPVVPQASPVPNQEIPQSAPKAGFLRTLGLIWQNNKAKAGLIILGIFVFLAIFAPVLAPYSPTDSSFDSIELPSATHLLGTTQSGQDVLSLLLYGTRTSLFMGFITGAFVIIIATIIGLLSGYLTGIPQELLSFLTNVVLVIPGLPLMIVLASYLPFRGPWAIILVQSVVGWAWGARVLRSQTLSLRTRDYITAASFAGEGTWRIVTHEIMPNMTSLLASSFFGAATGAVLGEAGLEFLGLGDPFVISWGTMLYWAQNSGALLSGQWAWMIMPGLCIALLATSLSLINFGIDAISNPKLREN
jgi:peptide/nickel transport system permease protein